MDYQTTTALFKYGNKLEMGGGWWRSLIIKDMFQVSDSYPVLQITYKTESWSNFGEKADSTKC